MHLFSLSGHQNEHIDTAKMNPQYVAGEANQQRLIRHEQNKERRLFSQKQRGSRPDSNPLQKRLQYLERKMESINLEESSCTSKGDWQEWVDVNIESPTAGAIGNKKRTNSYGRTKISPRKSPRLLQSKDKKEAQTSKKVKKNDDIVPIELLLKNKHHTTQLPVKNRKSKNNAKSLIPVRLKSYIKEKSDQKHEAQRTVNLSKRALSDCSVRSVRGRRTNKNIKFHLSRIERQLNRYQKQNKILKNKLKIFEKMHKEKKQLKAAEKKKRKNKKSSQRQSKLPSGLLLYRSIIN